MIKALLSGVRGSISVKPMLFMSLIPFGMLLLAAIVFYGYISFREKEFFGPLVL